MGVSAANSRKRPDEGGPVGGLHRAEREADRLAADDSGPRQRRLERHGIGLDEERPERAGRAAVELCRPGEVILLRNRTILEISRGTRWT